MANDFILIRSIRQVDNHTFSLVWSDGQSFHYRLSELQKKCPCAHCVDEFTGQRLSNDNQVDPQVRAVRLASVGSYAIKIQFTSGCSSGLYTFEMLRQLMKEGNQTCYVRKT